MHATMVGTLAPPQLMAAHHVRVRAHVPLLHMLLMRACIVLAALHPIAAQQVLVCKYTSCKVLFKGRHHHWWKSYSCHQQVSCDASKKPQLGLGNMPCTRMHVSCLQASPSVIAYAGHVFQTHVCSILAGKLGP